MSWIRSKPKLLRKDGQCEFYIQEATSDAGDSVWSLGRKDWWTGGEIAFSGQFSTEASAMEHFSKREGRRAPRFESDTGSRLASGLHEEIRSYRRSDGQERI
jgi:hypothetical protein